jgi:glycosyltransferase involved in cell wall biosynthesis
MRITFICCPFKTSFGVYANGLKSAIEKKNDCTVQWVASNCGCGDPMESGRRFEAKECDYFEIPVPSDFRSTKLWRLRLRGAARSAIFHLKARRYLQMANQPDVIHFQQILNAYGSKAVFSWLKRPSTAAKVVTVHELDADQLAAPDNCCTYNLADAIIVHCDEMRQNLIRLRVQPDKIHLVLHGTVIPLRSADNSRDGIVFYGGHKLMSSKGVDTLLQAIAIIRNRVDFRSVLSIHGHYGVNTPPEALRMAQDLGIIGNVIWLNQIPENELIPLYQKSQICVLPYSGSFAGLPASLAAACQIPVIATRRAGLPDHLGDLGVWVDENNPEQLAARILDLLRNEPLRRELGARLRQRAEECLSWDVIASQTIDIYKEAIHRNLAVAA